MHSLKRFFLICSGADLKMMEQCSTEQTKYAGLGATVFFTGFFAFLSAAFALFTVFDSYWIAIAIGLVWGLMIFNLDRYIVSGMKKEGSMWRQFLAALPRLILAVLISFVIARPLELRIFDKEIQPELVLMEQQIFAAQESEVRSRFKETELKLREEIASIEEGVRKKEAQRDEFSRIAQEEADGTGGSKRRNLGPIYKVKKADADKAELELEKLRKESEDRIATLSDRLEENDSAMTASLQKLTYDRRDGLAARIEALARISDKSEPIKWAGWFIILLIVAVESAPVLVKLISPRGPYDNLLKGEEFRFFVRESEEIAEASATLRRKAGNWPEPENRFTNTRLDTALDEAQS